MIYSKLLKIRLFKCFLVVFLYRQMIKGIVNIMAKYRFQIFIKLFICFLIISCEKPQQEKSLLIYGSREIVERTDENNKTFIDTIYHTIGDFTFIDQDSSIITSQTFSNSIYVTDFFFTTCPSICPKMTAQMMRVYEQFENNNQVKILSHSIDPEHDSVTVLKEYANNLGVKSDKWHFVTGDKKEIFEMGEKNYMVAIVEDENVDGGFFHGGHFLLVDHKKHIRGIYDGTDSLDVKELINDIHVLLNELNKDLDKPL